MKQNRYLILLAGLLAVFASQPAHPQIEVAETPPQWFFRATALYAEPTEGGASGAGGFGFMWGHNYGADHQHEMSVDWAYMDFKENAQVGGIHVSGSTLVMPSLVSYRYRFGRLGTQVRPYAGISAGLATARINARASAPGISLSDSDSKTNFAGGLQAGFSFPAHERWDLEIGYRYMYMSSASYTLFNESFRSGSGKAHVGHLGLGFRF